MVTLYNYRCPLLTMMQPEPVVSSSPNSVGGGGNKEESGCTAAGMAVSAAVAAAVEDSQQLALSCANSAAASGSGNFIPNHPQHSQYKGRILTGAMPNAFSVKRERRWQVGPNPVTFTGTHLIWAKPAQRETH